MRKGNVRARPPDAPQAHKGNWKGSTGKPAREYRRIPEGVQENPLPHTGEFSCFRPCYSTVGLTLTGFDCVAAFVSLPALSAVWWDCVMTAMPGMPKAYTPIVCVLSLGVRLEQPLAKLTMPPPIAPSSTGRIAAQSWRASSFQFTFSFIFVSFLVGCGLLVLVDCW